MTDGHIPYTAAYEPWAYTMWGEGSECFAHRKILPYSFISKARLLTAT